MTREFRRLDLKLTFEFFPRALCKTEWIDLMENEAKKKRKLESEKGRRVRAKEAKDQLGNGEWEEGRGEEAFERRNRGFKRNVFMRGGGSLFLSLFLSRDAKWKRIRGSPVRNERWETTVNSITRGDLYRLKPFWTNVSLVLSLYSILFYLRLLCF